MSLSGVQGSGNASNNNPVGTRAPQEAEEKHYSIFDKAPKDGTVSVEEQKNAFLEWLDKGSSELKEFIVSCGYEVKNLLEQCVSRFKDIKTDGTKNSAKLADIEVERRFNQTGLDILDKLDELHEAEEEKEHQQKLEESKMYTQQYNDAMSNLEETNQATLNSLHGKSKQEQMDIIRAQYPNYTEEDVEARYELQNLPYKSAEIFENLHSGQSPSEVLANYKQNLSHHINNTIVEVTQGIEELDDPDYYCKTTSTYDEHGRIISRESDYGDGDIRTSVYEYNEDGSYTYISTENAGIYTYIHNTDGREIYNVYRNPENNMIENFRDMTKEKLNGDID